MCSDSSRNAKNFFFFRGGYLLRHYIVLSLSLNYLKFGAKTIKFWCENVKLGTRLIGVDQKKNWDSRPPEGGGGGLP